MDMLVSHLLILAPQMDVAQETGIPKWVALVSGKTWKPKSAVCPSRFILIATPK